MKIFICILKVLYRINYFVHAQTLNILDLDFKSAILNMGKELRKSYLMN